MVAFGSRTLIAGSLSSFRPCVGPTLGAASVLAAQGKDLGQVAPRCGSKGASFHGFRIRQYGNAYPRPLKSRADLLAAQLLLQTGRIHQVPMLGELAAFDAPDIHCAK